MKKLLAFFSLLMLLALACVSQSAAPTQPPADQSEVATLVAATLQAMTTPVPTEPPAALPPTETQAPAFEGKPATVNNVSFVIPNGLASAASGAQIPAVANDPNAPPWDVAPAHLEITLDGYPVASNMFKPKIYVYPALDYAAAHQGAGNSIQRLQAILANPSSATKDNLPSVPFFNAAQMFAAQINVLKFQNGAGVRMVTAYGQAAGPISDEMTFYHFEGLTSDNKYYLIAIFPIQTTAENVNFPGYEADAATLEQYYNSVTANLNSAAPADFSPNLTMLEALFHSLQVAP
jgi:hypothetical protein